MRDINRAKLILAQLAEGRSISDLAEEHDVWYGTISRIKRGEVFKDAERSEKLRPAATGAKFTEETAKAIIADLAAGMDAPDAAEKWDTTYSTIMNIKRGRTWKGLERPESLRPAAKPKPEKRERKIGEAHPGSVLKEADVLAICRMLANGEGDTVRGRRAIARSFEVSLGAIEGIRQGNSWRHLTGVNPENWREFW